MLLSLIHIMFQFFILLIFPLYYPYAYPRIGSHLASWDGVCCYLYQIIQVESEVVGWPGLTSCKTFIFFRWSDCFTKYIFTFRFSSYWFSTIHTLLTFTLIYSYHVKPIGHRFLNVTWLWSSPNTIHLFFISNAEITGTPFPFLLILTLFHFIVWRSQYASISPPFPQKKKKNPLYEQHF